MTDKSLPSGAAAGASLQPTIHYGSHGGAECGAHGDGKVPEELLSKDPARVTCPTCLGWLPIVHNWKVAPGGASPSVAPQPQGLSAADAIYLSDLAHDHAAQVAAGSETLEYALRTVAVCGFDQGAVDRTRVRSALHAQTAELIARRAHVGQKEESTGDDYIRHVERVVDLVDGEAAKAVAWLHDVLEDTDVTADHLRREGISEQVIAAVAVLTRRPPFNYDEYIAWIVEARNQLAVTVKLADLRDHLRPNCPERLRPRYERALAVLASERARRPHEEETKDANAV